MNRTLGFIIVIVHFFGLLGIIWMQDRFLPMSFVSLGICSLILLFSFNEFKWQRFMTFLLAALAGFAIEVVGVKTGLLFGLYAYGENLGPKLFEVPVVIGLNWAALLLISQQVVTHLLHVNKRFYSALLVATLMTMYDFLLELVAPQLDYWSFTHREYAPLQNFIAWWGVSFLLALFTFTFFRNKNNNALLYGFTQVLFFVILEFALIL
ncbi:MAG: carotenoid biosynthesis protein [Bacteroidetes bacterium]|nr:carotenoid biosynthesis protein [Bacteroidota bacterium]